MQICSRCVPATASSRKEVNAVHPATSAARLRVSDPTKTSPLFFLGSCADAGVSAATPTTLYVSELDASVKGDDLTSHFKCVRLDPKTGCVRSSDGFSPVGSG